MNEDRWIRSLYDSNYKRIYRLAANRLKTYTGSAEDAQDVVQEVFLLAAQKDIRNHPKPEAWLTKATVNICENYMRKVQQQKRKLYKSAEQAIQNSGQSPCLMESTDDDTAAVDNMLTLEAALPPDDYMIIVEHYMRGRGLEEIAAELGISHAALRVRIHRIRKRLKEIFSDM